MLAVVFSGCSKEPTPNNKVTKPVKSKQMKKSKNMIKGAVVYKEKCHQTKMRFSDVKDAKAYILENELCSDLNDMELKKVSYYLAGKCKAKKCASSKCGKATKCGGGKCSSSKCGK
jgi:hypothetical protein